MLLVSVQRNGFLHLQSFVSPPLSLTLPRLQFHRGEDGGLGDRRSRAGLGRSPGCPGAAGPMRVPPGLRAGGRAELGS